MYKRYLKRVQECGQNSNLKSTPIIVHTTTGSILERLKSDMLSDIELPKSDEENTTTVSIEQIDDNADGDGYHNRLSADDCASSERCITASTTVRKSIVKDESFGGNELFPDCYSRSPPNLT
ncbi:unnamed protein product [Heterobilharzia americana]|nr:unnamed protein product [Heterobilharzia americana]